jgi:hypothetical protein
MENVPVKKPQLAIDELRQIIIGKDVPEDARLELIVILFSEDITIRELTAFLEFTDRIYGRLSPNGIKSYALRKYGHLRIKRIEQGSWTLILDTAITAIRELDVFLVLWLVIKYLPNAIQDIAKAYNEYEQGRLARENRKRIRHEMELDNKLINLAPDRRKELAALIDFLYEKESSRLPRAIKFTSSRLKEIIIKVRKKEERKEGKEVTP